MMMMKLTAKLTSTWTNSLEISSNDNVRDVFGRKVGHDFGTADGLRRAKEECRRLGFMLCRLQLLFLLFKLFFGGGEILPHFGYLFGVSAMGGLAWQLGS